MKRTSVILSVLAALALPSLAQADVVLEPGTKLTTKCPDPRAFAPSQFASADERFPEFAALRDVKGRRYLRLGRIDSVELNLPGDAVGFKDQFVEYGHATVKRISRHRRRLRVFGSVPVTWRGC